MWKCICHEVLSFLKAELSLFYSPRWKCSLQVSFITFLGILFNCPRYNFQATFPRCKVGCMQTQFTVLISPTVHSNKWIIPGRWKCCTVYRSPNIDHSLCLPQYEVVQGIKWVPWRYHAVYYSLTYKLGAGCTLWYGTLCSGHTLGDENCSR